MANINPLDVLKGNIHMSELPGLLKAEAVQEIESDEDEDEDTEEEEEEVEKSDVNPLDLLKAETQPRVLRQGSVTYVNAPAYELTPERSRRSLGAPAPAAPEQHGREDTNARKIVRTRDGTLTHPTGVRRFDDGRS